MRKPTRKMRQGATVLLFLSAACLAGAAARAQPAAGAGAMSPKALEGMQLFNQHCRVCHTKPLLTAGQYGPVLSQASLGGDEHALHDFIANGAPRMPGFKYSFEPAQIDAIVAYLKTVPAPPPPPPSPAKP